MQARVAIVASGEQPSPGWRPAWIRNYPAPDARTGNACAEQALRRHVCGGLHRPHVEQGEVRGLLGPNGAGKTTLLRMLLGLVRPDAGTVELNGCGLGDPRRLEGVAGFVEDPSFYPYLSGRANLAVLAELDGGCPESEREAALERVGVAARGDERVAGYSTGMRKRLGLAAALMRAPRAARARRADHRPRSRRRPPRRRDRTLTRLRGCRGASLQPSDRRGARRLRQLHRAASRRRRVDGHSGRDACAGAACLQPARDSRRPPGARDRCRCARCERDADDGRRSRGGGRRRLRSTRSSSRWVARGSPCAASSRSPGRSNRSSPRSSASRGPPTPDHPRWALERRMRQQRPRRHA